MNGMYADVRAIVGLTRASSSGLGPVNGGIVTGASGGALTVLCGEVELGFDPAHCDSGVTAALATGDVTGRAVLVLMTPGKEYFAIMLGG